MKRLLCLAAVLLALSRPAGAAVSDDLFFRMIDGNDIAAVRAAIADGQDVNARLPQGSPGGETPLSRALAVLQNALRRENFYRDIVIEGDGYRSGSPEVSADCSMVRLLVEAGADVNAPGTPPPLHRAAGSCPEALGILLAASADVNLRDGLNRDDKTPLFIAALLIANYDPAVKLACVEMLLKAGADADARANSGMTPLNLAGMLAGYYPRAGARLAKLLLEAGADPNARDVREMTPLMNWVSAGPEAVELLLDAGANPNARDRGGMTPSIWAALSANSLDSEKILELLAEAGADVSAKSDDGTSALWLTALRGNAKGIAALLKGGAEVDARTEGLTPLHVATGLIAVEHAENRGAFQERARRGLNVFWVRSRSEPEFDFPAAVRLLVEAGADVNALSESGTPSPENESDPLFHRRGDFIGKTPLDFARMLGNEEAAKYLESVGAKSAKKRYWPF